MKLVKRNENEITKEFRLDDKQQYVEQDAVEVRYNPINQSRGADIIAQFRANLTQLELMQKQMSFMTNEIKSILK